MRTVVDHDTKTFFQVELLRHSLRGDQKVAENVRVRRGRIGDAGDQFLWNDQ